LKLAAPYAFPKNRGAQLGFALLAVYAVYAASQMGVSWERVAAGIEHGGRFLGRMFPPNFTRSELLWKGLTESMQIAVLASALGIALALPFGLLGARNLMPAWISWPARLVVVLARSFHPVVVAIVFVKAVGFGALAGILALTVASIGFIGKLFTEAIEEVSIRQVEAIRATGAPFASVLAFGVLPQVFSRFIGFATYQLDSNLRNSTMVGIVGAGGIGGTLFAAFQRFDYDFVSAILISLIALIMGGELFATAVRRIFIDNATLSELFRPAARTATERRPEDD
jgi:phosphonate transport system permease protein